MRQDNLNSVIFDQGDILCVFYRLHQFFPPFLTKALFCTLAPFHAGRDTFLINDFSTGATLHTELIRKNLHLITAPWARVKTDFEMARVLARTFAIH